MIWMRSEGNSACEESPSCQLKKMIVNLLLNLLMKVLNGGGGEMNMTTFLSQLEPHELVARVRYVYVCIDVYVL